MCIIIRIFLALGVLGNVVFFTINPFSKKIGLNVILLGIVAAFAEGIVLGLPLIGIGILLLVIQCIYERCC